MEQVICDADHDYLGRVDYHVIARNLFKEQEAYGTKLTEVEKTKLQVEYLQYKHEYFTTSAINLRGPGKETRISELKKRLVGQLT
jgi:hypothetical protein